MPYALHSNCVSSTLLGDTLNVGCKTYILPGILETRIVDHSCGATNVHNLALAYGSMIDQDGIRYRTIKIGTQIWMAENLRTTKYRNGVSIDNITDNSQWSNNTTGAYCSYNNNTINDCPYGKLYNWHAVANTNQLCPTGWHIPSDAEWTTLSTFLGGESLAGALLKSIGTQYWQNPNFEANNFSGFSGLSSGTRYKTNGIFGGFNTNGIWWSASSRVENIETSWGRDLNYSNKLFSRIFASKGDGNSVRCVKD